MPRVFRRAVLMAIVLGLALGLGLLACGFRLQLGGDPGPEVNDARELEDRFAAVVSKVVGNGGVDYNRLAAHRSALATVVGDFAIVGPHTRGLLYTTRESRLAYYVNAYNALALYGVVTQNVEESVRNVHGIVPVRAGFGFYTGLMFKLDARYVNLSSIEHRLIHANFNDARVYAALVPATRTAPALRPDAYHAADLHRELDQAAQSLASDPRTVRVDDAGRTVWLAPVFEAHRDAFEDAAKSLRMGDSLLDWVAHYAQGPARIAVLRATAAGYGIRFMPVDWRLNRGT